MGAPALREQLIQDFVVAIYGKGLHPEDAAIECGVYAADMLSLRDEYPALAAAWAYGVELEPGKVKKPRSPLEIKHNLTYRMWMGQGNLTQRVVGMLSRIPDNETGDKMVMELLKNKIISETLPRETIGQQEITTKEADPYDGISDEELFQIAEKRIGKLADMKAQVDEAAAIRAALAGRKVIDVEYTQSDPGKTEGTRRASGAPGGRPALPLLVDSQAVAADEHEQEADLSVGGKPVFGEDDV